MLNFILNTVDISNIDIAILTVYSIVVSNEIIANVKIKCNILNVQCNYTSIKVCDKNFHQKYYIVLKAKHAKAITVKRVIFKLGCYKLLTN